MKNFYQKGMTIMELLVIVTVIGILVLIVLPQFSKIRENQVLKSGVQDILSSINKARAQTLSSLDSSEYGIYFQIDKVIIFKGIDFSENSPDNEIINIVSPASITNVILNDVGGSSGNLYFNRLSGSPSKTGDVTISTTSYSKIITISATGVASVD